MNGHVADAEQGISQEYNETGDLNALDLAGLQLHLNTLPKRIKISDKSKRHQVVIPDMDFIEYWAYQFSGQQAEAFSSSQNDADNKAESKPGTATEFFNSSNVISMAAFKKGKTIR